jgi:hypothetical protein
MQLNENNPKEIKKWHRNGDLKVEGLFAEIDDHIHGKGIHPVYTIDHSIIILKIDGKKRYFNSRGMLSFRDADNNILDRNTIAAKYEF